MIVTTGRPSDPSMNGVRRMGGIESAVVDHRVIDSVCEVTRGVATTFQAVDLQYPLVESGTAVLGRHSYLRVKGKQGDARCVIGAKFDTW